MRLSLLGTGWLGSALAKHYIAQGWSVMGSTTQKDPKIQGLHHVPICLSADQTAPLPSKFFNTDYLIITLPFRRNFTNPMDYLNQCKALTPMLAQYQPSIRHVIFTSSTGVYSNYGQRAKESDSIVPETDRQRALLAVEDYFLSGPVPATVVRLGGLYGPGREKGRFIAARKARGQALGGGTPVNMIHLYDCIKLITAIIQKQKTNTIYNGVHPGHPTKSRFYGINLGNDCLEHKRVCSQKATDELGLVFQNHATL